ncbi:MAG: carbohydrate kinase family protein [Anaerolineae bacterium]|nr:carbohydrate kinase family protein [Anaerolineae bacterium]
MNADRPVLVIGAAGIDITGRPRATLQMGTANPGVVRNSVGGVARNIAENLARLEVPTILLSAVGQDNPGEYVIKHTAAAGVDTSHMLQLPDIHTGSYVAVLTKDGQLVVSVSEYDIVTSISPAYLWRNRSLFAQARMIVLDANLSVKALDTVFRLSRRYHVPVCADPTADTLTHKLTPHLPDLYVVAPNAAEAAALCGTDSPPATSEHAIEIAQCLVNHGVKIAIVTLAEHGLAYASGYSAGHIPALRTQVVDATGVGDALTAAVIFGLLNEMPLDEAVRLGISAASLTLRTRETVVPDLSLDRLYDELVV